MDNRADDCVTFGGKSRKRPWAAKSSGEHPNLEGKIRFSRSAGKARWLCSPSFFATTTPYVRLPIDFLPLAHIFAPGAPTIGDCECPPLSHCFSLCSTPRTLPPLLPYDLACHPNFREDLDLQHIAACLRGHTAASGCQFQGILCRASTSRSRAAPAKTRLRHVSSHLCVADSRL